MNTLLFALFACGEKTEDTAVEDTAVEETDTAVEDTDTEDTSTEETDTSTEESTLEILGSYSDSWGGVQTINEDTWADGYGALFHISQFDNEANFLIAQNDAANEYSPELWSKFQWTTDENGGLFYCQSMFDAASEEDAMGANADASDLASGCSGFGWTEIRIQMDLTGDFVDSWGTPHNISAFTWLMDTSLFHIGAYSNEEDWAVAQNDATNEYNPELYSKFEWTNNADGAWFYCQSAYDAATMEDAMAASADNTDLEAGCGGFGWSELTVPVAE